MACDVGFLLTTKKPSSYTVDYSSFFDQIADVVAKGIQENLKVPELNDRMTADFSTTTAKDHFLYYIDKLSSRVFPVRNEVVLGCGIPAVEMLGAEDDWSN